MKKGISGCLLLAALLLFPQPAAAGEKARPTEITTALKSLDGIGLHLGRQDWESAAGESRSLQKAFDRLIRIDKTDRETIYRFGYTIGRLQVSLMNRDRIGSEENLLELRALMYDFADRYDYSIPPALTAMSDFLHRCDGCLEAGKFKEIVLNLRRAGRFFRTLYENLEERGVTNAELWEYHRRINSVMVASEAGNASLTGRGLAELRERTDGFFALFEGSGRPENAGAAGR